MDAKTARTTLVAALRDESRRPRCFEWNYCHPCACAMGLARALGITDFWGHRALAQALFLPDELAESICYDADKLLETRPAWEDVTPEQIATLLEQAFAQHPIAENADV